MDEARAPATAGVGPGTRLAGRYLLLEQVGRGGMARVFRARDLALGREVAIKLPEGDRAMAQTLSVAEARTAAGAVHPGIAAVYDVGSHAGSPYIVMELVPGVTLRELLRERGRLSEREALDVALALADALAVVHARGFSHCDVKPRNVVMTPEGKPKLVDFGIARELSDAEHPGEAFGTAAYVAPEQARGLPPGPASDVYALGTMLYEMLTGRPPFAGGTADEVVARRLEVDPTPPRALDPSISPPLERVVLRALARDPGRRYANAAALAAALRGAEATPSAAWGTAAALGTPALHVRALRTYHRPARGRLARLVAAAVLAGAALVGLARQSTAGVSTDGAAAASSLDVPAAAVPTQAAAPTPPATRPSLDKAPVRQAPAPKRSHGRDRGDD